jgi:2-hydroxy-3-keto-5-methylthiopentenyl-1-phosphate phosphatase
MSSRIDWAIVCDFDGTIACADVGNTFFAAFARPPWAEVVRDWEEGRIGSRECLEKECALSTATMTDLRRFSSTQNIDPHFQDIVGWAERAFVPLCIVSDGFREYIHLILERHGLKVPCFANRVEFDGDQLLPHFPYYDLGCLRCANCKGYHMRRYRDAGFRTLFIGDGLSDLCALPEADRILAKGDLADYCQREGIANTRIADLRDALSILERLPERET